jgi:hypothetical protein
MKHFAACSDLPDPFDPRSGKRTSQNPQPLWRRPCGYLWIMTLYRGVKFDAKLKALLTLY